MADDPQAPLVSVHVEGAKELEARWDMANEILSAVMLTRAAPLAESMKLAFRIHAPVSKDNPLGQARATSHLRDSIEAVIVPTAASLSITVGVPPDQVDKVTWLREGTRPHSILPKSASALHFWWDRMGMEAFAASVQHPGTSPNRWEEEARAACEALVEEAGLEIGKAMADGLGTKV